MRCNEFDELIDEMLSGVLHPEATQHMQHCARCHSLYRARNAVHSGLRELAMASAGGPSRHTDEAVMDAYRMLQQRRVGRTAARPEAGKLVSFPRRAATSPLLASRTWWSGAAAAAVMIAVFGSAVHLWNPSAVVQTPAASAITQQPVATASFGGEAKQPLQELKIARRAAERAVAGVRNSRRHLGQPTLADVQSRQLQSSPVEQASLPRTPVVFEDASYQSGPVTQMSPEVSPVVRLATTSAANSVAQKASSTWPGYSNLMYCDPVVCSGPMQVVHIRVPVNEVKPNVGQSMGNAFVNADLVVGPDGVARAIRVAR